MDYIGNGSVKQVGTPGAGTLSLAGLVQSPTPHVGMAPY